MFGVAGDQKKEATQLAIEEVADFSILSNRDEFVNVNVSQILTRVCFLFNARGNEQLGPVRNGTNPFTAGDPDQDFRAQLARQMMMQSGAPADMIMQSGPPVDETQQRAEFARQLLMQSGGPMDEAREVGARGAPSTRRMRMRAKGPEVQMSYEEFVAAIQSRGDGASPQYVAMMEEMTGYKAPPGSIANEY